VSDFLYADGQNALDEANRVAKKNNEKMERYNYCAYEALEVNPFGKELLKFWHEQYICKINGPAEPNLTYHSAQTDFVRLIHGMVASHKELITTKGETS